MYIDTILNLFVKIDVFVEVGSFQYRAIYRGVYDLHSKCWLKGRSPLGINSYSFESYQ